MKKRAFRTLVLVSFLAFAVVLSGYGVVVKAQFTSNAKLAICLDDGYASTYNLAFPFLDAYDIPATVAIAVKNVSSTFETITMMTWAQIEELETAGWAIASHGTGYTVDLSDATEGEILRELNGTATDDFATNDVSTPSAFVIPSGITNDTAQLYIMNYYENAWALVSAEGVGNNYELWAYGDEDNITEQRFHVPRYQVDEEWANLSNSVAITNDAYRYLDALVANGSGYGGCLLFHHLTESPRGLPYCDVQPSIFTNVTDYARSLDIDFVTLEYFDSYFAGGTTSLTTSVVDDWLPTIMSFAMLGMCFGFIRKLGQ